MPPTTSNLETRNAIIGRLVALLAAGKFEELIRIAPRSRVSAHEIEEAAKQYARRILPLPEQAFEFIDYIAAQNTSHPEWSVVVPLYTEEEGRSDLSLELTIIETSPSNYEVQVDDIHVL